MKATEILIARQREHYDAVFADAVKQAEALELPPHFECVRFALIEGIRKMLDDDLERCALEISHHASRGFRVDEPLH